MKQNAGAFFFAGNDPVFDLITTMKNSWQTNGAGAAATTTAGLNILARVALVRLTSGQVLSPASKFEAAEVAGGNLVSAVALCMTLGPVDATTATNALRSGVFEVRGSIAGDPPALARPDVYPRWGAEAKTSWIIAGYPRYLVYGTPGIDASALGGETPTVHTFNGFEISTLPTNVPKSSLRVGICVNALVGIQSTNTRSAVNLLIHDGVVLPNSSPSTAFCTGAPSAPTASLSTSAWFASLTNRITSVFSPASLFAQERGLDFDSFTGGGPSSWSPQGFGQIAGSNIALTFTTQPVNGTAFEKLNTIVVHAATVVQAPAAGHTLEGVDVTISVANNSGTPAGACVVGTLTVTTNSLGDAIFDNVTVKKAGGYTITATGVYQTVPTQNRVSNLFNVKNKKGDTNCQ
jgi:hypothetical protein